MTNAYLFLNTCKLSKWINSVYHSIFFKKKDQWMCNVIFYGILFSFCIPLSVSLSLKLEWKIETYSYVYRKVLPLFQGASFEHFYVIRQTIGCFIHFIITHCLLGVRTAICFHLTETSPFRLKYSLKNKA